jgi:hypothetical protein
MRDEEQIRLTLALYSRFNDYKDEEAWTLLYAPDAVVVARQGQEWHGRNAIREFMRGINTRQGDRDTCHLSGNVVIAIDDDTAKLDADMLFHERTGDVPWRNSQLNRYTADLVRASSGWLFSRWEIRPRLQIVSRSREMAAATPLPGIGEINKTLALYANFLDDHDAENWSKLFASDGRLVLPNREAVGRSEIKDMIEGVWARNPDRRVVHFCTTSMVRADTDTATAETEVSEYEPADEGAWQALGHGRYYDRLVRAHGRWLIQERRVKYPLF